MNIFSAVLAVTLALDGGVDQLYVKCPPSDMPFAVQADGGEWTVPDLRMRRTNCRLAACESFAADHLDPVAGETVVAPPMPVWLAIAASVVVTLGLGIYLGVKADQAVRP
jgi:hypothetical protein